MSTLLTVLAQAPGLDASGWFMLIGCIGFVLSLCAFCFWHILKEPKRSEQHHASEDTSQQGPPHMPEGDPQLAGIRGWLILPAIGLVLGLVIGVVVLIVWLAFFFDVTYAGHRGALGLEILVRIGFLCFQMYVAFRFFGKRQNAPSAVIVLVKAGVAWRCLYLVFVLGAGDGEFAWGPGRALFYTLIGAAIWIPYFRKSKQVKATFVR